MAKNVHYEAKNVLFKVKNICFWQKTYILRKKRFANIFVKFCKNFAITKLPISFDHFNNFETGHVLYFAKHKTTKLSAFYRALMFKI